MFLATSKYPRIVWTPSGGSARTIDFDDGILMAPPTGFPVVGGTQIATSGLSETVILRTDEIRQLMLQWGHMAHIAGGSPTPPGSTLARVQDFLENHAELGEQFELLVNRFQGAKFEFINDTLEDENRSAATYTPGSATYADGLLDRALVIAAADHVEIPRVPAANAPRLVPGGGMVLILVKPTWAGDDGVLHTLLDCGGATTNRLTVRKSAANDLELEILDNAGGSKKRSAAVSWSAGAWQAVLAIYRDDGTLDLWLNEALVGAVSGAGTGLLNSLGATIFLASDTAGANRAAGDYERVALYTRGFRMSAGTAETLKKAVSRERNFYATAELAAPTQPVRADLRAELYQMPLAIRKGV